MDSNRAFRTVSTALAAVLGFALPGWATPRSGSLIVPGRAVGPVSLGMRLEQLVPHLGPPVGPVRPREGARIAWPARGLTVRLDREGRVDAVFVDSPEYRTAQGVGVGSSKDEVLAAFGPPSHGQEDRNTLILAYPSLGISFAIRKDRGGRVEVVMVYRPG